MEYSFFLKIFAGIITALAGAVMGSHLVLRKLSLISDSMPHMALPGIALGVVFGFNPIAGALLFLISAVLLIWFIENKTDLEVESIVGVLFVTSLAIGASLVSEHELLESFFGSIEKITNSEAYIVSAIGMATLWIAYTYRKAFLLIALDREVAQSIGLKPARVELVFLLLMAITVASGIRFVGLLLMSALLIVPAVSARNLGSGSLRSFFKTAMIAGTVAMVGGLITTNATELEPGIAIVLMSATIFIVSLFYAVFKGGKRA